MLVTTLLMNIVSIHCISLIIKYYYSSVCTNRVNGFLSVWDSEESSATAQLKKHTCERNVIFVILLLLFKGKANMDILHTFMVMLKGAPLGNV